MFKLLREYQAYILGIGVSLLMFVFLIQGPLATLFRTEPTSQPVGTANGKKIIVEDQRVAENDLNVLDQFSPMFSERSGTQPALRLVLILRDAQSLGIAASNQDVAEIKHIMGVPDDEDEQAEYFRKINLTQGQVDHALRTWLIVQQYKELVYGLGHMSVAQRMQAVSVSLQRAQQQLMQLMYLAEQMHQPMPNINQAALMANARNAANGQKRVSDTLLSHLLQEVQASAKIEAVAVDTQSYMASVPTVPAERVEELFKKYRDRLPGEPDDQGYTLGYKSPDRVKIEYLWVPVEQLRSRVHIDETDVLSYYDQHRDEFREQSGSTTQPAPPPPQLPTDAARARIIEELTESKVAQDGQAIIKTAAAMLADQARGFKEDRSGYRPLPADWKPMPLADVAAQIQKEYGILPKTDRLADRWLDMAALAKLPGIGSARVEGTKGATLPAYVHSAKELNPKSDDSLTLLHLQVGLPSQPMTGFDGSRYLFRLIDAKPARVPPSLDEEGVREQVTLDARRIAAYEVMLKDRDHWSQKAKDKTLKDLSQEIGKPLLDPPAFQRRVMGPGGTQSPDIEGIGRDRGFVDGVFSLAESVALHGPVDKAPVPERSAAIPSVANLTLFLVRVDKFEGITQKEYDQVAGDPGITPMIQQVLCAGKDKDALSLEVLKKRTGFVSASTKGGGTDENGDNSPSDSSPAPVDAFH